MEKDNKGDLMGRFWFAGLSNPYAKSQESSDRHSQFSTARDHHELSLFGGYFWEDPSLDLYEDRFLPSAQEPDELVAVKDLHSKGNPETSSSEEAKISDFRIQRIQPSMPSSFSVRSAEQQIKLLGNREEILEEGMSPKYLCV